MVSKSCDGLEELDHRSRDWLSELRSRLRDDVHSRCYGFKSTRHSSIRLNRSYDFHDSYLLPANVWKRTERINRPRAIFHSIYQLDNLRPA